MHSQRAKEACIGQGMYSRLLYAHNTALPYHTKNTRAI